MSRPSLTRNLTLEAPERVADGGGGYQTTWRALGTLWAEVRATKGRASEGAAGPLSRVPLRIVVRAAPIGSSARPVPGQRFAEGSRRYAILAVTESDAHARYLDITCEEETAA